MATDYTTHWGFADPDRGTVGYETDKGNDATLMDLLFGGGERTEDGAVSQYNIVYLKSDGEVGQAQANAAGTMPVYGFAKTAPVSNQVDIQRTGIIVNGSWNFAGNIGAWVYASAASAGAVTTTMPTGTNIVQIVGKALTATSIEILIMPPLSAASDGFLSVDSALSASLQTIKDPAGNQSALDIATGLVNIDGNLEIGGAVPGTSSALNIAWASGTAPTGSYPADAIQMYVKDIGGVAGKAGLHIREEGGYTSVIGYRWGVNQSTPTKVFHVGSGNYQLMIELGDIYMKDARGSGGGWAKGIYMVNAADTSIGGLIHAYGSAYGTLNNVTVGGSAYNICVLGIDVTNARAGFFGGGITCLSPEQFLDLSEIETLTAGKTDGYAAALRLDPGYTAATAQTVTRHNYIDVQNVSVAGAGPAAVTNSALFRFDAAIGAHGVLAAAFQTTDSGADTTDWAGGIIVNANGTLYKIPIIAV